MSDLRLVGDTTAFACLDRVSSTERILQSIPEGVVITDASYRIVAWNQAASGVLGWAREEVLGRSIREVLGPGFTDQACKLVSTALDAERQGEKEKSGGELTRTVLSHTRPDGDRGLVEASITVLREDTGKPVAYLWLVRDISDRHEAELALRQAHAETSRLLDTIPSILICLGPDGRVRYWNRGAEKAFAIAQSVARNMHILECPINWDRSTFESAYSRLVEQSTPVQLDVLPYERSDGSHGILGITIYPLSDEQGHYDGCLVFGADITERQAQQAELAQAQKLESIGRLAAGIAHEINTPTQFVGDNTRFLQDAFSGLVGALQRTKELLDECKHGSLTRQTVDLLESEWEQADVNYLIAEIPRAIEQSLAGLSRVTEIVRALKEFSHPGSQEMSLTDINHSLECTATISRNEWKYVATLETDFDPNLPAILCLEGDLNQAFLNIIVNAAHAIQEKFGEGSADRGKIRITTRDDGEWVEIRIQDNGTGIPQEIQKKIFDPFFTTKEPGKGTGQGLTLARSIVVDKHGGTLRVHSTPGEGATFVIRLPKQPPVLVTDSSNANRECA